MAIVAGLVLAVVLPPLYGYDEGTHLDRAWQLSDGRVFAETRGAGTTLTVGGRLPVEMVNEQYRLFATVTPRRFGAERPSFGGPPITRLGYRAAWSHLDDAAPRGPARFYDFSQSAVYSPVVYLPAAVSLRLTRWFGASLFVDIALARLSTYAGYVALMWIAIRRTPVMPWLFVVAGLLPVALSQAMTIGADAITNGLFFAFVAEALRLSDPARITRASLAWIATLAVALGFAKAPYYLILFALGVAIWRAHGRARRALVGVVVLGLAAAYLWTAYAKTIYVPSPNRFDPGQRSIYAYHDINRDAQLRRIVRRPWVLPRAMLNTIGFDGERIARDTVVAASGWVPYLWQAVVSAVAVVLAAMVGAVRRRTRRERWWLGLLTGAIAYALFVLAYIGWNAYGALRVDQFQGRYLFPLLVPALVALWPSALRFADAQRRATVVLAGAVGLEVVVLVAYTTQMWQFFT